MMSWFKKGKDKNHTCSFCGKEKKEEELMGSIFSDKTLICCDCLIVGIEQFSEKVMGKMMIQMLRQKIKKIKNKKKIRKY